MRAKKLTELGVETVLYETAFGPSPNVTLFGCLFFAGVLLRSPKSSVVVVVFFLTRKNACSWGGGGSGKRAYSAAMPLSRIKGVKISS